MIMTQEPSKNNAKWNLNDLYFSIDDPNINQDLSAIEKLAEDFIKLYQGKVVDLSARDLFEAIKSYEIILEKIAKLQSYSYLIHSSNFSDDNYSIFYQSITEKTSMIESQLIFFPIEINQIEDHKIQQFNLDHQLKFYQPFIRDIRFFKKHILSNELEKILIEKNITSKNAFIRLFDETINGLKFPYHDKILNCQEIFNLANDNDEKIREEASLIIAKIFKDNVKTFGFITNILAKDKAIEDQYRKFSKPISSRNLSNFIDDEIVELLCQNVKENYAKTSHRYYQIKANLLGKKKLKYWDRNASIDNSKTKKTYSWNQAKELILDAYQDFHPEMSKIAKLFFDNNWIDAEVRNGKESGAYSHPCVPSVHPYILMNFQGNTRDVMTLAHELGHGIHQYLSKDQGFLQCSTPLTLAETASVFGEQLTFQKLLNDETNPELKKIIIANKIEDMINTVVRQIAFLEFEKKIHDHRKIEEISVKKINQYWLEVQMESLGSAFEFDEDYQYYWCYISHFIHSPFYVYSYAFGDCLVNSLYAVYNSQKISNFNDKYLEMLKSGGINHHQQMLQPFNINISDKDFWQSGLNILISYIDQLEKLI